MRIISGLLTLMIGVLQAADYYVSTTGNDANSGTLASPFATIQHAVDQATSGDTVYVRAGTYREEVDMSGDSNVTLTAYLKEAVTISGCDIVTGAWTAAAHDANIQQLTISTEVMQLFVGGERMNLARYPDEDAGQNMFSQGEWTPTTTERQVAGVGQDRVLFQNWADGDFPDNYWAGGFYSGHNGPNSFTAASGKISSSAGRYLHVFEQSFFWEREAGTGNTAVGTGQGYIINHLNALSTATEWYWSDPNDTLFCYPPSGGDLNNSTVEARLRLWGLDLRNASNVQVEGIDFFASSIRMDDAQSCTVTKCRIDFPAPWTDEFYEDANGALTNQDYGDVIDGSTGVFVSGSNNVVDRCYIGHSWCSGIRLEGTGNTVSNCFIEDINWLYRRMQPIQIFGDGNTAIGNTVQDCGQSGIDGGNRGIIRKLGTNNTVQHNIIRNATRSGGDSGAFYINSQNSETETNLDFSYNVIDTVIRATHGVYLDNGTSHALIHHNLISDPGNNGVFSAARGGAQHEVFVYNNTSWGGDILVFNGDNTTDTIFRNNLSDDTVTGAQLRTNNIQNANSTNAVVDFANGNSILRPTYTAAIDSGFVIPGITDGFSGSAPDIGCYESGQPIWSAGTWVNAQITANTGTLISSDPCDPIEIIAGTGDTLVDLTISHGPMGVIPVTLRNVPADISPSVLLNFRGVWSRLTGVAGTNMGGNDYSYVTTSNTDGTADYTFNIQRATIHTDEDWQIRMTKAQTYCDTFNDGALGTNPEIGGGLGNIGTDSGDFWSESGGEIIYGSDGSGGNRASAYSLSEFDLSNGFTLEVAYTFDSLATSANNLFSFGLVSNYVIDRENSFGSAFVNAYGIGFNLAPGAGGQPQGLIFAESGTLNLESGFVTEIGAHTLILEVLPDGNGGANWSYTYDGNAQVSGQITDIDLSSDKFTFVTHARDSSVGKSIQHVKITPYIYSDWAAANGLSGTDALPYADPDQDGLANVLEAWLGTNPNEFNTCPLIISTDQQSTTFIHPQNPTPPSDLSAYYEWSPNLTDWYLSDGADGPAGGATVTASANTVVTTTTVNITASEPLERLFFRIAVLQQ